MVIGFISMSSSKNNRCSALFNFSKKNNKHKINRMFLLLSETLLCIVSVYVVPINYLMRKILR